MKAYENARRNACPPTTNSNTNFVESGVTTVLPPTTKAGGPPFYMPCQEVDR